MSDPVLLERDGGVAYLTLNRPEIGNAIDVPLARCLLDRVQAVEADTAVRCVVLRAAGRMFCAGGDVQQLAAAGAALPDLLREILAYLHPAIERMAGMAKPVVTAIHGPAAGAGLGLAAVGDVALAAPGAHFTAAYGHIGLTPDGGATWLLPRLVGMRRAQEILLTNRRIDAQEAAAIGLITRVVEEGGLAQAVDRLAQSLARSAVGALGRTKGLLMAGDAAGFGAQLDAERDAIASQGGSEESRIGIAAFISRQPPAFAPDAE